MHQPTIVVILAAIGLLFGCSDDSKKADQQKPPAAAGDGGGGGPGTPGTPGKPGQAEKENLPAEVVSLTAGATEVAVGGATDVTARVVDAENDPFYVYWQSSCGAISADPGQRSQAVFLAPLEPGACRVTVEVAGPGLTRPETRSLDILITPPADQEVADVQ